MKLLHIEEIPTLVIFAFRTRICFRGAIVLDPFFAPVLEFPVGALGLLGLIVPCAISVIITVSRTLRRVSFQGGSNIRLSRMKVICLCYLQKQLDL